MNLTYEQTLEYHKNMWIWIAEQIEEGKQTISIQSAKREYIKQKFAKERVEANCFACEYDMNNSSSDSIECNNCPLNFEMPCFDEDSLYMRCKNSTSYEEQKELALRIANIGEREI